MAASHPVCREPRETQALRRWVSKTTLFTDSRLTLVLTSGGHNDGIVGEPGHPHRSSRLVQRPRGARNTDPDGWAAARTPAEGSWWREWNPWLRERSSREVVAHGRPRRGPAVARAGAPADTFSRPDDLEIRSAVDMDQRRRADLPLPMLPWTNAGVVGMIALEDIIGMCGLSEAEVDAIAEHEHIPEVAAAALASYLMHAHRGPAHVQTMICEDIRDAIRRDDVAHARELFMALHSYVARHPEAVRGSE